MCHIMSIHLSCCVYAGSCFQVKIEADVTEHDDKPGPYVCRVCNKQFTRKDCLTLHSKVHGGQNIFLYSV